MLTKAEKKKKQTGKFQFSLQGILTNKRGERYQLLSKDEDFAKLIAKQAQRISTPSKTMQKLTDLRQHGGLYSDEAPAKQPESAAS